MKKIITVCLMLVMIISMSVSVFAEVGGFIESPSNNQAPELVNGKNESDDCTAQVVITAFADRHDLSDEARAKLEEAYKHIVENSDLSKLHDELDAIADEMGIDASSLAVSDLFDISAVGCDDHEDHGHFDIALKSDALKHFVCLLHYYNGVWRIVEDAEVTHNGEHLEFTEKEFSPFAIVVNTGAEEADAPQTGDNLPLYIALAAVAGLGLIVLLTVKSRKSRA